MVPGSDGGATIMLAVWYVPEVIDKNQPSGVGLFLLLACSAVAIALYAFLNRPRR